MLVFVGGPSCSGKTAMALHWDGVSRVHLDRHNKPAHETAEILKQREETAIFEGFLCGRTHDIERLLGLMDFLIVLDAPLRLRINRMLLRDGILNAPRFIRNEFYWYRHNRPILFQQKYDAIRRSATWEYSTPVPQGERPY